MFSFFSFWIILEHQSRALIMYAKEITQIVMICVWNVLFDFILNTCKKNFDHKKSFSD